MVAISLYKGNLHKVPNLPRRWLCPVPNISLKDFRILLLRRQRALSRLRSSNPSPPKPGSNTDPVAAFVSRKNTDCGDRVENNCSRSELLPKGVLKEGEAAEEVEVEVKVKDERAAEGEDSLKKSVEAGDTLVEESNEENAKGGIKEEVAVNPLVVEKIEAENDAHDQEKRKKEIEDKLEVLNEKKHSLVQVLKQILNAEEQLKRQNTAQGVLCRPPLPQMDTTTDSGSVTRLNTPKTGSDGTPGGDMEGGEADDVSNHNMHSHHLPHASSTSPSSDTQQRKPASSSVQLHPHRAMPGVAGSPSRFAPAGQGHSSVSVSGTSYIASTPSPAASGGTSVFREGRLPSPWN